MELTDYKFLKSTQVHDFIIENLNQNLNNNSNITNLRKTLTKKGYCSNQAIEIINQIALIKKATKKLGELAIDFRYTKTGLEQCSRIEVAKYRASQIKKFNIKTIADLGSGIGIDSFALAKNNIQPTSYELDIKTSLLATLNLENLAIVKNTDVYAEDYQTFDAIFSDPARRKNHKRIYNPNDFSPNLGFLLNLSLKKPTVLKLSPGIKHNFLPENSTTEWISHNNEVVEACLWLNDFKTTEKYKATILKNNRIFQIHSIPDHEIEITDIKKYLYDPDGAVIRAKALSNLAKILNATIISKDIGYLTSNDYTQTAFATSFEIIKIFKIDHKIINNYCLENEISEVEIKTRGINISPEVFRTKLNIKSKIIKKITLILTKSKNNGVCIVAKKLT